MKKYLIILSILFVTAIFYTQPILQTEQDRVVYEDFKYQPVLIHTFEIKNIGDQDLEIFRARPT